MSDVENVFFPGIIERVTALADEAEKLENAEETDEEGGPSMEEFM